MLSCGEQELKGSVNNGMLAAIVMMAASGMVEMAVVLQMVVVAVLGRGGSTA